MKTRYLIPTCALFAMLMSAPVLADEGHEEEHAHYDVSPYLIDGELLVGGLDHDENHYAPPIYAFGWTFGEGDDPDLLGQDVGAPGYNQKGPTGSLPSDASIYVDVVSPLMYWDGTDPVAFSAVTDGTFVQTGSFSDRKTVNGSGGASDIYISDVDADGDIHIHHFTELFGLAPDGIYAMQMEMELDNTVNSGSVHTSHPFWIVMNRNLDHHEMHEAMEVLGVPEPGTIGLLLSGLLAVGFTFRRRRA